MWSIYFTLFLLLFPETGRSQVAQDSWSVPDGQQDDFTVTLRKGQTIPFSWRGWSSVWTDTYLNKKTINDLWVTSYDYHVAPFAELIAQDIDVSRAGSFTWSIDIPDASLSKTAKYVLRFKNPADPPESYDHKSSQLSSRGFIIVNGVRSPSSTPNTTSPSATASASATNSVLTTPSNSPPPQELETIGLSAGAKTGIGVGSAVGGIAIIGLIVFAFLWQRCRSQQQQQQPPPPPPPPQITDYQAHYFPQHEQSKPLVTYYSEVPGSLAMAPVELPASRQ
ncbi:hypothetical protein AJ80_03910 [Polytolypa hystricis UAMH7299]|uniref:Mid2 domain-containing protein n=1 Tax=Polytolypa hystricis (strain UAMH7299) TaxID=1447883 RepID=A0A2B7Y5Y7_POLH7|nr:hypothetical protein AJ80_03910 [Polytolypa hystricis UAMH7299]